MSGSGSGSESGSEGISPSGRVEVVRTPSPIGPTPTRARKIPLWAWGIFGGADLMVFDLLIHGIHFDVSEVGGTTSVAVGFSGVGGAAIAFAASLLIDLNLLVALYLYGRKKLAARKGATP